MMIDQQRKEHSDDGGGMTATVRDSLVVDGCCRIGVFSYVTALAAGSDGVISRCKSHQMFSCLRPGISTTKSKINASFRAVVLSE